MNCSSNSTSSSILSGTSDPDGTLYRTIGVSLAIASGVFIGSSFVFKKRGLLDSMKLQGAVAGEGHGYLKNPMWWTGMILMIVGEVCNFVAYAFTQAILVTPLGALSVVISAVLSSIFLNERLNFQGKVGCALCIVGATIIVLHAPEQKAAESSIADFERLALAPGFLTFAILDIVTALFLIFYAGPRWGKSNIFIYISVCSMIGGLSVVSTQALGSAIVNSVGTRSWDEFKHPSLYVLLVFVVVTLLTEINYLNKALNLFNTALVTPIYYVIFTSMTIICSAILFQGFNAAPSDIITLILGFFVICAGILLLQTSRSSDPAMLADADKAIIQGSGVDEEEEKIRMLDPSIMELRANPFGSIRRFSRYDRDPPPPPRPERVSSNIGGMHFRRRSMLEPVSERGGVDEDLENGLSDSPISLKTPKRFPAANRSATIAVGGGRDGVRMYHIRDRSASGTQKIESNERDSTSGGDLSSTHSPTSPFSTISSRGHSSSADPTVQRNRTVKFFSSIPEKEGEGYQLEDTSSAPFSGTDDTPDTPRIPPPPAPPNHQSLASLFPDTRTQPIPSPIVTSSSVPVESQPSVPQPSSPIQNITSYFSSLLNSRPPVSSLPAPVPPPHSSGPSTPSEHSRAGSNSSSLSQHSHRPAINPLDQLRLGMAKEEDGDRRRLVSDSLGSSEDENGANGVETSGTQSLASTKF